MVLHVKVPSDFSQENQQVSGKALAYSLRGLTSVERGKAAAKANGIAVSNLTAKQKAALYGTTPYFVRKAATAEQKVSPAEKELVRLIEAVGVEKAWEVLATYLD
jgi:hypothetical protein